MKQCPVCEKTFDDNMRFCQADGTPLVEKSEPVDPYKTMVASKEEIAAAMPPLAKPSVSESAMPEPSVPAPLENELLEIPPAVDPNKTMFVSEAELRAEMDAHGKEDDEQVIDMPPAEPPTPPVFSEPSSPFGDAAPPPSPFSAQNDLAGSEPPEFSKTSPPIPSPFDPQPEPEEEKLPEPEPPPFVPTPAAEPSFTPFEQPAEPAPMAQAEFNPPPVAESNMQNPQNFGQGAPAAGGPNQTLAIVSLVVGILSLCCGYTFIVPIIAIVLGFMAKGKANSDPANYGGAGLALGGIITGAVALLIGVVVIILNVVMGFGGAMLQGF